MKRSLSLAIVALTLLCALSACLPGQAGTTALTAIDKIGVALCKAWVDKNEPNADADALCDAAGAFVQPFLATARRAQRAPIRGAVVHPECEAQ